MAAPKRATHVVKHKRLYLAVEGKLTHFPAGEQLTLSPKQSKGLGARVEALTNGSVDLAEVEAAAEAKAKAAAEAKA